MAHSFIASCEPTQLRFLRTISILYYIINKEPFHYFYIAFCDYGLCMSDMYAAWVVILLFSEKYGGFSVKRAQITLKPTHKVRLLRYTL